MGVAYGEKSYKSIQIIQIYIIISKFVRFVKI